MTKVIDINDERGKPRRKPQEPQEPQEPEGISLYFCECGCGLWRLHADAEGTVECVNCGGVPGDLRSTLGE